MGFVIRRSLPSLGGLVALMLAVGFAGVVFLEAPLWFPVGFAVAMLLVQFVVNPWVIQWLVPARVVGRTTEGYDLDHPLGRIVAARCRAAGVPLVKLGIVDDGTPNAFTFGRSPRDARIWVTRGLLERLDERELDAVIAHEVGHIKHWDFVVMTVAAVVPMVLYLVFLMARGTNRLETVPVAIGAYIAYLFSQLTLLSLSRARETAADHWSCATTGDGDALASALVKVAYGMGQVSAAHKAEVAALVESGKEGETEAWKRQAHWERAQSMRAMGIFEPRSAEAMEAAFARGIDPERAMAAMRWDLVNPWGATLEKLSSHPLVARRIQALEQSGLPGAPRQWSALRAAATAPPDETAAVRTWFSLELALAVGPWAILGLLLLTGVLTTALSVGVALVVAGFLFFAKQSVRYPGQFVPVDEVAGLLEQIDAGPVAGIPVEVRGQVIGRGFPGYVLSPDLVIQDGSGFVPLLYNQPLPLAREWFGLAGAEAFMGEEVVARGWYRRQPGPVVELRDLTAADGTRARAWEWVARYVASAAVLVAGVIVMLIGMAA